MSPTRKRKAAACAAATSLFALGLTLPSTGGATYGKGNGLLAFQASQKGCPVGSGATAADADECESGEIATARSNGSGGKKVLSIGAQPSFSPAGGSLAFAEDNIGDPIKGPDCFGDESVIFVIPSGGGPKSQVTKCKDGFEEEAPSFSPSGGRIAFESTDYNRHATRILTTTLSGTGTVVLAANAYQPAWGSNDRIAFVRGGDIWTMKSDGSDQRRITKSKAADFSPDWSPGTSRIAFARNGEIYTVKPNGKGLRRLTRNRTSEGDPVWAPDGNRIAFAVRRARIDVMKPNGKGRKKNVIRNGRQPAWQPKQ